MKEGHNQSAVVEKWLNNNESSKLPEQLNPSPVKPLSQAHMYEPLVLLHVALRLQLLALGKEHSSISTREMHSKFNKQMNELYLKVNCI